MKGLAGRSISDRPFSLYLGNLSDVESTGTLLLDGILQITIQGCV